MARWRIASCALLAAAACAGTAPPADEHDVVARIVGASLAPGDGAGLVAAYSDAVVLALGGMPAGLTPYEDVMITGQHGAGAHGYMVMCRDLGGAPIRCSAATASAAAQAWFSLAVRRADLDAAIHFQGTWALGGMLATRASLTGAGTLELAGEIEGDAFDLIADVEHDLSLLPSPWVMGPSGTTRLALRDRRGESPLAGPVEVAFDDGWASAAITIGDARRYRIDLVTGAIAPAE